jgi:prepilin-type processing-associated H-X9-DG protein
VQRKKGITLKEMIVVIGVIGFLALIVGLIMPRLGGIPERIPQRAVCGTNLKGLGTAMDVYAHDYDGRFPQLPGTGLWSKNLGFAYDNSTPDFKESGEQHNVGRTITASWYLLVRECDVSPKSFVCTSDKVIKPFDGKNPRKLDIVELWDFGTEPHKHVSYAMHNPYGAYPGTSPKQGNRPAGFAVAADMSPWFRQGDFVGPVTSNKDLKKNITLLLPYFSDSTITREQIQQSNAIEHGREGQNVTFADGHAEYVKTSDVGVKHDNIYTYWSAMEKPTENDIRIGTNPTARDKDNDAKSADDSFLAI